MERRIYYKPDGGFKISGLLFILLFSIPTVIVTSFIYNYLMKIIPFIYLNFIFCIGYGFIVAFAVSMGAKKGKIRNPIIALICGLIIGIFAEYAQWVTWFFANSDQELWVTSLSDIKDWITVLLEEHSITVSRRSSGGIEIKGAFLAAVWAIEGLVIVLIPALFARHEIATTPYCETCEKWVGGKVEIPFISIFGPKEAIKWQLEKGEFYNFMNSPKCSPDSIEYLTLELIKCPSCSNSNYLTVKKVTMVSNGKKVEKKDEVIAANLIINYETYCMLLSLKDKPFVDQDNVPIWQNQNNNQYVYQNQNTNQYGNQNPNNMGQNQNFTNQNYNNVNQNQNYMNQNQNYVNPNQNQNQNTNQNYNNPNQNQNYMNQ